MKNIYVLLLLQLIVIGGWSQDTITGFVYGKDAETINEKEILIGANVYWLDVSKGAITDEKGRFEIPKNRIDSKLIISYIGYISDTIDIAGSRGEVTIILTENLSLEEITISKRQKGEFVSNIQPIHTKIITEEGLQRLPCCNLAESFENTAAVDAGFTDAVSGARQIKMLGLAGKYSQILIEKRPSVRGLSNSFGLMHILGSWMESIQISKGTSSVVDGFESISGQINIEYKKPDKANPLHVNLYSNNEGRFEANVIAAQQITDEWSTMVFISGGYLGTKHDHNNDGFLDAPLSDQIHVLNRWKYSKDKIKFQTGIDILYEKRLGGQTDFYENEPLSQNEHYGISIDNRKYVGFFKGGIPLSGNRKHSLALISNVSYHEMNSFFGLREYVADQKSLYVNAIYMTDLWSDNNSLTSGINFTYDEFEEVFESLDLGRKESVKGIYSEYSYNNNCDLNIIAGIRYDYSSLFGGFLTPRMHAKYNISYKTIARASFGRGHRVTNIIAENIGVLASSRQIIIDEPLLSEDAWNAGVSLTHDFHLTDDKVLAFSVDYYRTQFVNQVMVDVEQDKYSVHFYNLDGTSYSNSLQVELSTQMFDGFDITGAFRVNDVKVTLDNTLQTKPFTNKYKGLVTMSYLTPSEKWGFDFTTQYNGKTRLPDISENMNLSENDLFAQDYYIVHAQLTRNFDRFSVYFGSENLTDFVQKDPIIDPENPFGDDFDASRVWGPIIGRMIFLGVRFNIE